MLPLGWLVIQACFVIAAGGDWMGDTRYLAPLVPALAVLAAEAWSRVERTGRARWVMVGGLLVANLGLGLVLRDRIPDYTREGEILGRWLRTAAAPGDTVAVTAAGAIPYFSGLPALDVLGINDPRVGSRAVRHTGAWAPGHHRYDVAGLLDLDPRWIVWDFGVPVNEHRLRELRTFSGDPDSLDYRRALLARPAFRERYRVDHAAPPSTQGTYTVFRRRGE